MAQVDRATRSNVDHLLKWATAAWAEVPEVEREIDSWDLLAQLVFTEEWGLEEDRLLRLAELAQSSEFTEEQSIRYRELLSLVERNRPALDRIMQG